MAAPPSRDVAAKLHYYLQEAPRRDVSAPAGRWGHRSWSNIVEMSMETYKNAHSYSKVYPMTIVDGRSHLPGGKEAWKFDTHGFCYIQAPDPVADFKNYGNVKREYGPRVCEAVRKATGAKKAFWMSHVRRQENKRNDGGNYARGTGHSDYGPEFEEQFRIVLTARYGVPEEEAQTCGLCLVNMWVPVEQNAYKDPLALLDSSSIDIERETVPWKLHNDLDNGYKEAYKEGGFSSKAVESRVPAAAQDAPALAPTYAPHHRWVYLSDMTTAEAVIFKQYDFRKSQPAKATFHLSFPEANRFHEAWPECPGRRSLECRLILTFDPEETAAAPMEQQAKL